MLILIIKLGGWQLSQLQNITFMENEKNKETSKFEPTPDYVPNPETKTEKHQRLLEEIKKKSNAPDFYEAVKRGIECYTSHHTRDNEYSDICTDLRKLQDFFYLQTLLDKEGKE